MEQEALIIHRLQSYFDGLARHNSTASLKQSLLYQSLKTELESVMSRVEYGFYAPPAPVEKKPFYRAVAWNIERGIQFDGVIHVLKCHPEISQADMYFITETDIGMARTENRNVARELARELGLNYFFGPSYLNLCRGNSIEGHYEGPNTLGLHGNAFFSRYPIENLRLIPLHNCKDKMKGREKRIGCQRALVADVCFPYQKLTVIVAHLDAHSSQRQRASQMQTLLEAIHDTPNPVLLGGDLNTNSYNTRHAFFAFCGFWHKVFRGVDKVIDEHYPYPDRYFDRFLFQKLKEYGFDYESFNELGIGTLHYEVEDIRGNHLIEEVVPDWCRKIMEETLKRHGGKVSLKLDWFAGRNLSVASQPKVISGLKHQGKMISDHDPILADITCSS